MVDIKKLKIKSQNRKTLFFVNSTENLKKCAFLGPVNSISTFFFRFSEKYAILIDPSGHFVFYEIFCGSNFYNSFFPNS